MIVIFTDTGNLYAAWPPCGGGSGWRAAERLQSLQSQEVSRFNF